MGDSIFEQCLLDVVDHYRGPSKITRLLYITETLFNEASKKEKNIALVKNAGSTTDLENSNAAEFKLKYFEFLLEILHQPIVRKESPQFCVHFILERLRAMSTNGPNSVSDEASLEPIVQFREKLRVWLDRFHMLNEEQQAKTERYETLLKNELSIVEEHKIRESIRVNATTFSLKILKIPHIFSFFI